MVAMERVFPSPMLSMALQQVIYFCPRGHVAAAVVLGQVMGQLASRVARLVP